ncbi:DNA-binding MarR family transcriptional regulator [Stackebrandtia albiflava]|uniref:DNA-binding MarR family transcriptional regulator n=1 Tax=Stackebrandtia albiflava TaxID=406432 RepID=A0A562ULM2_9ACTN|nr:MarR family transcriptional regulator [Stackebrandtia albiflava]TWJ06519.1 DNA-binding MarR family transcriptional regulator [Stackebrandtia albiflava]
MTPDPATVGREFSTAVVMFHDAVADRLGLSAVDHKALGVVMRDGPITASRLAAELRMKPSAVTGLVDRLVAAGYVGRTPDPTDRRRVLISAHAGRRPDLGAVFGRLGAAMAELAADYRPEELAVILDYLGRATTVMREQTARLHQE